MTSLTKKINILSNEEVRTRIAPSPTGPFHIGTARTALVNYLFTKKYNGTFILRIDNTDIDRSDEKFEKDIIDGLNWLGIKYDEGVGAGGEFGPYRQTERSFIYNKYIKKLLDEKKAYLCFCAEDELRAQHESMLASGFSPKYSGKCRNLSENEILQNNKDGKNSIIRLIVAEKKIFFNDIIRGKIEFDSSLLGDFPIAKGIDLPLYNFASTVDDYEMKITHVIRGEDHISNTPKQIIIQEALEFTRPQYAHLPLILSPDRTKLSKRNAVVSIEDYKNQGYLPEALINFMAFLGWNPGDEREFFSIESLIKEFDLSRIQKSGAIFNIKKLEWLNSYYIRKTSPQKLFEQCIGYLIKDGLLKINSDNEYVNNDGEIVDVSFITKALMMEQERLKKLDDTSEQLSYVFQKNIDFDPSLLIWKNMTKVELTDSLNEARELIKTLSLEDLEKNRLKDILTERAKKINSENMGFFLWPLRVALSGRKSSPSPFEIIEVLGVEKTLYRIQNALQKAETLQK